MSRDEQVPELLCTVDRNGAHATVRLSGEIDMANCADLAVALDDLIDDGIRRLVLDFAAVHFVDSSGLHVLLRAAQRLDGNGAEPALRIAAPSPPVRRLLEITSLANHFGVNGDAP